MNVARTVRRVAGGLMVLFLLAGCEKKLQAFLLISTAPDAVPSDAELTLEFSRPMDPESAEIPLVWNPPIAVTYQWDDEHTHLMFSAQRGFAPGRSYTFIVRSDLKTADGETFEKPIGWTIAIRPTPQVVARKDEKLDEAGRHYRFRIQFDLEMDTKAVTEALQVTPETSLRTSWSGTTLTVETSEALSPGEFYHFEIGREARAANGAPLRSAYVWSVPVPTLIRSTRAPGVSSPGAPLAIEFNYPIDFEAFRASVRLTPDVLGEWTYDAATHLARFIPDEPLPLDTSFTLECDKDLVDVRGERLGPFRPVSFHTPPAVLSIVPESGSWVELRTPIVVKFAREMDRASAESAFRIFPDVEGSFSWRQAEMTFRPEGGVLAPETTYTVTLDAGLKDATGTVVQAEPVTRTFKTRERTPLAQFAYGVDVLVAEPRKPLSFPFSAEASSEVVTFQVYRLSEEQFAYRYMRAYHSNRTADDISWQDAELAAHWEEQLGRCSWDYGCDWQAEWADGLAAGFYVVNLVGSQLEDQRFLIVAGNYITVKSYGGQVIAWVTTRDGRPVADADIAIYTANGQRAAEGDTDGDGLYETWVFGSPPVLVVSHAGLDLGAVGIEWAWSADSYGCGLWRASHGLPKSDSVRTLAQIHTDRPIYRPGDTVYFKAILRRDEDGILSMPNLEAPVTVRIRDGRDNLLQTFELTPSRFGTVNGKFSLTEGAMLGPYTIEVESGGDTTVQRFKVEDYRKPDYQVTVTLPEDRYVTGQTIQATVEARYLLGQPVADAQVTVRLYSMYGWDWDYAYEVPTGWGKSGTTDENGRWTLTLPAPQVDRYSYGGWSTSLSSMRLGIEATVDDGSHQTVAGMATRTVYNALAYVTVKTEDYSYARGQLVRLSSEMRSLDGEALSGETLTYTVSQWRSSTWDYAPVWSSKAVTGTDGVARVEFTPERSGWYEVEVTATDATRQPMKARGGFYVRGTHDIRSTGARLSISADRDTYAPGDSALLLIESDFAGPALFTMERASVRRHEIISLTPPVTSIEIPIRTDDVPNIFATVSAWMPPNPDFEAWEAIGGLGTASVELSVPPVSRELNVTITPAKTTFTPREEATFRIEVTSTTGGPAAAELSLALVDEAIFTLSPDLSPGLLEVFHGPREHDVETFDTLSIAGYLGDGCGGGGGGGPGMVNPRSDFPDTVLWLPRVETGEDGVVDVQVTMPDSLTTWRLTVRAVALDSRVGEAIDTVLTTQPLVIRPLLPRQMVEGDAAVAAAAVHNYSDQAQTVTASLAARGLSVGAGARQTFVLSAGEVRVITWPFVAAEPGEAELTFRVEGADSSDAVLLPLTVERLAVHQVFLESGDFDQRTSITFDLEADALPEGGLRIEVSRDVAASLLQGLDDLTRFPYGCVEQTMSAVLPNAVIAHAFQRLGVAPPGFAEGLKPKVDEGLARLYALQHYDGGWGWWFDDDSDDYQTAWVLLGLSLTRKAGYDVDQNVLDGAIEWVTGDLDGMDPRTRAFALYSLAVAGAPESGHAEELLHRAEDLDPFSQAALALALQTGGNAEGARRIVDLLAATAERRDGMVRWSVPWEDGEYNGKTMASDVRATALALSALEQIENPYDDLIGGVARWLMSQRRSFGWGTTNETAFAILGLTDYMVAATQQQGTTPFATYVNGDAVGAGVLDAETPSFAVQLAAGDLKPGRNTVQLTEEGAGRLYYLVRAESYLPRVDMPAEGQILISRAYLDPRTKKPLTQIETGQLVLVQLSVRLPEDGNFMIVEDHPPAGLEPLNERLNTTSYLAGNEEIYYYEDENPYFWDEYGYNYKEIREGRVSFFIRGMGKGLYSFDYFARATHSGTFVALPAEVWAMYNLDFWGRSAMQPVEIVEPPPPGTEGAQP